MQRELMGENEGQWEGAGAGGGGGMGGEARNKQGLMCLYYSNL